jgi:hypothetical protein
MDNYPLLWRVLGGDAQMIFNHAHTAIAAYRKVQPISKSKPTHDYSDKITIHLSYDEACELDNAIQDVERKAMELERVTKNVRDIANRLILPGCVRGLR